MWKVVSLCIEAIEVVKGIPFGQASTQFCAIPHSAIPPVPIKASKRSFLVILPFGCKLNNLTCEICAAPMKSDLELTFGHTSKHTLHDIHLDNSYATCRFFSGILGPGPKSYVPSIGTHALTRFKLSNMNERSTCRSRTIGKVLIGSNLIGCSN